MTKRTTFIAMAMILIAQITSATVWRVNNRADADADFTTIQAAHDGATAGDILYIEGSPTSYGALTCTKQLHIIGAGDFLNDNSETQAYKGVSNVSTITFNAGSENSIIEGVRIVNTYILINTSDITVRRNRFHTYTPITATFYGIRIAANSSNVLIENNWMYIVGYYTWTTNYAIHSTGANLLNLTIRNNYIYSHKTNGAAYTIYLSATVLADNVAIYQNVINSNSGITIFSAQQTQFYNNIMMAGAFTPDGSYYNNNIGNSTQFGSTNGNQENVATATIFIDPASGIDSDLQLLGGSPALAAGIAGEDCGIYGGSYPYHISLLPAIPAIWEVTLNNYGSDVVPINVNIKAKAHN